METLHIIITVIQLITGVVLTAIVLMQSGKSEGLSGAISGGADSFLSKNKAKSLDGKLAAATKYVALAFVLLTLSLHFI